MTTKRRMISTEEESHILNDFRQGMNTVQLGEKYNRNNTTIGRILKRNGLSARNIKSKLSKKQIMEAYVKYSEQLYTTEQLGAEYNVDANTIANSFRRYNLNVRPNGYLSELKHHDFFETIDNEAKAYFLGFVMCDGSIREDKTSYRFTLEIEETDKHILYSFAELLGLSKERVRTYHREDKNLTTSKININSKEFCIHLMNKGVVCNKTGLKQIPLGVPEYLLHHTIRGMVDADGSIDKDKQMVHLYGRGLMTKQVTDFLNTSLDLKLPIQQKEYANVVPRMTSRTKDNFLPIVNLLYKDAHFYLKRKYPF